jgi:DNA-damage-inducible protein J
MEKVWQKVGNKVAGLWKLCGNTVRLRLTKVAREHALPFDPLIPNATTIAAMREARAGGLKSFDSVDALMADLHAEDGDRFMEITDTTFEAANRRGAAKKAAYPAALAVRYDRRTARIVISLASGLEIAFLPRDV